MSFWATFAVGNICGNPVMTNRQVDEDLAKLAGMGADVTGAVEIDHPYYRHAFRDAFAHKGQRSYNLVGSESPTATALPVRRSWIHTLHKGFAKVTPARRNAFVRLETAEPVLVIVKHPVSGAFRTGAAAGHTFNQRLRRRLWELDRRLTARRVNRAHRNGVNVVILTDANTVREPRYHPAQVVANHAGLMWIIAIPAPHVTVDVSHTTSVPVSQLHTDHPFLAATLTFTRSKR